MSLAKWAHPKLWLFGACSLLLFLAAGRIWLIPAHFSLDPNEGWNAFQAVRALGAGPLYPPVGALTGNNYPPLSFYLVGWAGLMIGDPIIAGRLVALISVLAVAAAIFVALRRFGGPDIVVPAIGALLFLGFAATLFRPYLGMDDPQWLAHALMTSGFALLLPARADARPAAPRVILAALLMVTGGMVKHNLVALPLAATLWLMLHHRVAFGLWLGTALIALLAAGALCFHLYGADIFTDLLFAERHYSLIRMSVKSLPVVAALLPLLVLSARLPAWRNSDRRFDLLLLAVIIALPIGILQRSGQGVDKNAHFEALIALCLAGPVALRSLGDQDGKPVWRRPGPWLCLPFLILAPIALAAEWREIADRAATELTWRRMEDLVKAQPGRVACETQALCFWAGKDYEIDFFLYGQHMALTHDAAALRHALVTRRFDAVELDPAKALSGRPGEVDNPIPPLLDQHFYPFFTGEDGRRLLRPMN